MPYNFVADNFHMKKLCSRLFNTIFFTENGHFAFLSPFGAYRQCMLFILGLLDST